MSCYPCTHCNRCGMFSLRLICVCAQCGQEIPVGSGKCPECGCTSVITVPAEEASTEADRSLLEEQ